jgi:hypothetical protein
MMIPDPKTDALEKGIAFIDNHEIALGDLNSLKEVLDIRGQEGRSILNNETMAALIRDIGPDPMFWFAGDVSGLISKAPSSAQLAAPLMASSASIKSIVASMNIDEALTGNITATALSSDQALKLADAMRGLIAFGQLSGNQHPELKTLLGGFKVSQDLDRVKLDLNIPADILTKMGQSSTLRR